MPALLRKIVLAVMLPALVSTAALAGGNEFRLGVISDKPVGRLKEYTPLAAYVAGRLGELGITGGKVVVAKDTEQLANKIRHGEVDVVFESAFPIIELQKQTGMVPRLLVWKKGHREYSSVIFVRRESTVRQLTDLQGKTIVFEDPSSTSAYLLPKADLVRNGLIVLPMEEKGDAAAVRFRFGGEETNQAFFVVQKRADAGAFSSDDWNELAPGVKAELRVVHETRPVVRFIASFHPGLSPELSDAIAAVLVEMDRDPEGRKILGQAAGIRKIEPLSTRDRQSLAYVQELMNVLAR